MNYVDRLVEAYKQQLRYATRSGVSGGERTWFLVIDPDKLRSVLAQQQEFEFATADAKLQWRAIDLSRSFGAWMNEHRYKESYFKRPKLANSIEGDFADHVADWLRKEIEEQSIDTHTVLALTGVEAIYGISRLSDITRRIEDDVPGTLLVFFPGQYHDGQYRFFDARDGWNYLAVPILPITGKTTA